MFVRNGPPVRLIVNSCIIFRSVGKKYVARRKGSVL